LTISIRSSNHWEISVWWLTFKAGDKPFSVREQFVVFADKAPDIYTYKLLNTYPHDKNAYTQGLEFYKGLLYESTGQYGLSSIRKTEYSTGEVVQKLPLDASYFGEGLTFINDVAVQLTLEGKPRFYL
jgi:glutaminyl-peptide cyclotransferase